jgi:predicted MFS family arabinose efflux permease
MTIVGALQSVSGGGFVALMVVWCDRVLGIGTQGLRFGLVYGAWSVGGLIAASLLPRILKSASAGTITLRAIPFSALLGVLTCFAPKWPVAALGLFAWGCVYTLVVVNSISYRQQVTPEALLGRVNTAGRMLAWGVGWTLGAAGGGLLGSVMDVRAAMAIIASVAVLAVAVAWMSPLRYEPTSAVA